MHRSSQRMAGRRRSCQSGATAKPGCSAFGRWLSSCETGISIPLIYKHGVWGCPEMSQLFGTRMETSTTSLDNLPAHELDLPDASATIPIYAHPLVSTPPLQNGIVESPVLIGSPIALKRKSNVKSFPAYIPPMHMNRTLVLCFDGTGEKFSQEVCVRAR